MSFPRIHEVIAAVTVLVGGIALGGCDNSGAGNSTAASVSAASVSAASVSSTGTSVMNSIKVGSKAPDATLKLHNSDTVTLASLKGHKVLLWFYPKDNTSG